MKRFLTLSFISLFLTFPAYGQAPSSQPSPPNSTALEQAADPLSEETESNSALDSEAVAEDVSEQDANNPDPETEAVDETGAEQDVDNPSPDSQSDPFIDPSAADNEENASEGTPQVIDPRQMALNDIEEGEKELAQQEEAARLAKEKEEAEREAKKQRDSRIDILELIKSGGYLMWPLGALSILGLMFILERFIALRYNAIMPRRLFKQMLPYLEPSKFSPTAIWAICNKYRSPAARVIQSALLKIGRPLPEIISAVEATKQDEAANMYRNVGWLTLVSSLAPLLGLLGTVWGMIQAFHQVAILEIGANRAEQLSSGIYVALVTTAAGLAIAIPVALFAHFFESRILKAFHKLDAKLLPLLDVMEKQEGKPRISLAQYQAKK